MSWNRNGSENQRGDRRSRRSVPFVLAVAFVPLLALVCGIALLRALSVDNDAKRASRTDVVASSGMIPTNAHAKVVAGDLAETAKSPSPAATTNEWNSARYPGEKIVSVVTNRTHIIELTEKPDGTRTRHVVTPPPVWKTSTDGLLAMILTTPPNQEIPPLPDMGVGMDEEFKASLSVPIEIQPGDSDEIVAMKKIVASAREEVKELLANGEHFCDIIADHHALCNENGKIRGDAIRELAEIRRSGDEAGAREYCIKMNAAFSQMGIPPIGEGMEGSSGENLSQRHRRKANQ